MELDGSVKRVGSGSGRRWGRMESALVRGRAEAALAAGATVKEVAAREGVPRTTLTNWLKRGRQLDGDPVLMAFLESPTGVAFLHRLVVAAMVVFCLLGACGLERLRLFLQLGGLEPVLGISKGELVKVMQAMVGSINQFDREETPRLAKGMRHKPVSLAEDENFHQGICLVCLEVISGFVLLLKRAERRDAATWAMALAEAIGDLPVRIMQLVSDEAKGLLAHAKDYLGVTHVPDLFHLQYDLSKAFRHALRTDIARAQTALEEALALQLRRFEQRADYWQNRRSPGRPPAFADRIAEATIALTQAADALAAAEARREEVQATRRELSRAYHPYDLVTGQVQNARSVGQALQAHFDHLARLATEAHLSGHHLAHFTKARKLLPKMVAAVAFYHRAVGDAVTALGLAPPLADALLDQAIPGLYLQRISRQAPKAHERRALRQAADALLVRARAPDSPLAGLDPDRAALVWRTATDAADLFVRASSALEGANGHLSLHHHGHHQLSQDRLDALKTLANYFIRRPDGSTAAERFFEQPHRDLFAWLLDHTNLPVRPRRRSPRLALAAA